MEINRSNIIEIVKKSNAEPDKDYGQNFLVEPKLSEQIASFLDLNKEEKVLEVGPGLGSLTHYLYQKCNLEVCDIDSRMINFLKVIYQDEITLILNDVRKTDVSKYDKIIGNLPYNITSELVTFLLINATKCQKMVLMCQQEAFNHFYDTEGKEYGPISILLHLLGTSQKLLTLKPGSFYPAPKCNSLVFVFDYHPVTDRETIFKVYKMSKSLFLNRRKTIYNNLKNYLNDSEKAINILNQLNIELTRRPEQISPNLFLEIYNAIK